MAPAEQQWGFPSPVEAMPQSPMVLLQTVAGLSNGSSSFSNTDSENTRESKSHAPILKSYPKITPHPSDVPTKRLGSSKVRLSSTSGYDQRPKRHHHDHGLLGLHGSPGLQPAAQTTIKSISNCEAANQQSQAAESQDSDTSLSELAGSNSPLPDADEFSTDIYNHGMDADQDDALSTDVNKLKHLQRSQQIRLAGYHHAHKAVDQGEQAHPRAAAAASGANGAAALFKPLPIINYLAVVVSEKKVSLAKATSSTCSILNCIRHKYTLHVKTRGVTSAYMP